MLSPLLELQLTPFREEAIFPFRIAVPLLSPMPLIDPVTMSAPAGKAGSAAGDDKPSEETVCRAMATHASPLAQAVRHVHPAVLVASFYAGFGELVRDPVAAMAVSLPAVVVLQVAYAVLCLPAAGSPAKSTKKPRPGEKRKPGADAAGPSLLSVSPLSAPPGEQTDHQPPCLQTVFVALGLSTFATLGFHTFFVLFGAPLLTHIPQTLLCTMHLSMLGLFPLFYTHGIVTGDWVEILGARAPFDEAFGGLVGGCVGAWVGAVPIPLDWDREWQKWPITILCGIYGGYVLGKLVGGTIAFGKRFGS